MKNRKLLLIVSLVLALTMSLGGTLAYLTDTDADVNTMVLGNVKIVQNEQERVKTTDGGYTNVLQPFTDGQMMLPAVYEVAGQTDPARMKDLTVNGYELSKYGVRTFPNYVDKLVSVTNISNTDAYVRTLIAVPSGLKDIGTNDDSTDGNVSEQWLHFNVVSDTDTVPANGWYYGTSEAVGEYPSEGEGKYIVKDVDLFDDGKLYTVIVATNKTPIEADETTGPNLVGLYLDNDVNYKDGAYYAKGTNGDVKVWDATELKVYVLSQAVQAQGFDNAWVALQEAFGTVDETNVKDWFAGWDKDDIGSPSTDGVNDKNDTNNPPFIPEVTVTTFEELKAAAEAGKTIKMANDIEGEADVTAPYGNKLGLKQNGGIIDGGNNELTIECYGDDYGIMTSGGTIRNLTIEEGCRAVMVMYPTEDVILENVNIGGDGVLYPVNTGESAGVSGLKLIVTDSVIKGWTSFELFESASFTNVEFGQGTYYNNIYGRVLKPYVNTTIKDCSFIKAYNLDLTALGEGCKVVIENCTADGQKLTADLCTIPATDAEYDTCTFTVDLPSWATSIEDCVIFK